MTLNGLRNSDEDLLLCIWIWNAWPQHQGFVALPQLFFNLCKTRRGTPAAGIKFQPDKKQLGSRLGMNRIKS